MSFLLGDLWNVQCDCGALSTVRRNAGELYECPECGRIHTIGETPLRSNTTSPPTPTPTKLSNPKSAIGDSKAPLHLCSPIAMVHWALAQFAGLIKYGAWNWRAAGVRSSAYIAAIQRHLLAYQSGEEFDPVDGTHHLGNIMACCAILLEAREANKLTDDRPPMVSHRRALEYAEGQMARLKEQYKDKDPRHYTIEDTDELGLTR